MIGKEKFKSQKEFKMTRKEFLGTLASGVVSGFLIMLGTGCSSDSPTSPDTPSDGAGGNDQESFTSTVAQGHSHTVTINRSEVENPPSEGITKTTSSGGGHTHSFSMTQQQLTDVNNGQTVTVTDSSVSGHTHDYEISKWF